MMTTPEFLTVEEVLDLHELLIRRYGGEPGVRDLGLLESAVAQPMAMFGGQFLHTDLVHMAAAYLFHIPQNHPFVDGNKRTGLQAALAFLGINGLYIGSQSEDLYKLTMGVASRRLSKDEVTAALREIVGPGPH